MSDLEYVYEMFSRSFQDKPKEKLPENWNKGNVIINVTFEDGQLKKVEVY